MTFTLTENEINLLRESLNCLKFMLFDEDSYYHNYSLETKKDMYQNCQNLREKLNYYNIENYKDNL